jgi:hypothetical protein
MEQSHSTTTEREEQEHEQPNQPEAEQESQETPPESGVSASEEPETEENEFTRYLNTKHSKDEPEPEPEPEPEVQGQADPEPEPNSEPEQQSGFDAWPEPARAEVIRLQQYAEQMQKQYNAVYGRLAPIQRAYEDLRKQLHEKESAPPPTLKDLEENDAYKEIVAEFPDEAEAIKKVFGSQHQVLEQAAQQQQRLQQALEAERKERIQTELQRLQVRYPNYRSIQSDPLFGQWREARPEYETRLNTLNSDLVSEALDAFKRDLFQVDKAAYARLFPTAQATAPQQTKRPTPPRPSPPSQGSGLSGARRSGPALTEEQAFAEYLKRKHRS